MKPRTLARRYSNPLLLLVSDLDVRPRPGRGIEGVFDPVQRLPRRSEQPPTGREDRQAGAETGHDAAADRGVSGQFADLAEKVYHFRTHLPDSFRCGR